jgi:SAM-dependent methyltransferase
MPLWKRQPPPPQIAPALRAWFRTPLGAALLEQEQRLVSDELGDLFGYHALQLGFDGSTSLFADCRVQRCFQAGPLAPESGTCDAFVQCEFDALPFDSDSLDGVVVHHALEFAANPHAVLRELYRVTLPQGRVLIVGFNPLSLFGARMLAGRMQAQTLWHNHLLSAARVCDWLELLGFGIKQTHFGFHRLPFHRTAGWLRAGDAHWAQGLRYLPFGAVHVITAVKQVARANLIRARWRPQVTINPLPVARPSASVRPRLSPVPTAPHSTLERDQ